MATLDPMPLQNRVTPLGELIATPERGLVYGNRGCLHDDDGRIRRRYATKRWIACRLRFRDRHRAPLMAPGRYTELFFLDEVTALAAGHRPCGECRWADHEQLLALWADLHPHQRGADAIDRQLHEERLVAGTRRRRCHRRPLAELPDGTFILREGAPWLVLGTQLLAWTAGGYTTRGPRPRGEQAIVITPPSLVALLGTRRLPVVPLFHPTARGSSDPGDAGGRNPS
jgi:hypothetical protein